MAGRPTKYEARFCQEVEDLMRLGYSKTAAAGAIGISRDTLLEWSKEDAAFSGAVKRGEAARTHKLETDLLLAPDGPNVTSRIFALKNAAPEEWRDRQTLEHTGKDGGAIQTEDVSAKAILKAHLDAVASRTASAAE